MKQKLVTVFRKIYKSEPMMVVRAPGRVNLMGEHTDYNSGFVLPMAIDRAIWIALALTHNNDVSIFSLDYNEVSSFNLSNIRKKDHTWIEYVKGVCHVLQERGYSLPGWQGVMRGDIPIGAGLSSSAAFEMAIMRIYAELLRLDISKQDMALLGQSAENQWVGVNCGIMDQLISVAGIAGHALLIDCRSLETEAVPIPADTRIIILDTATRRGLETTAYNERRRQCEEGARYFNVSHLRDVSIEEFIKRERDLDEVVRRRCRHVIKENERTRKAAQCLQDSDAATFGKLMLESHISLRDDFEVSLPALNSIVEIAMETPGCYGARMTGAGFGGCAVALVDSDVVDSFVDSVEQEYQSQTGISPRIYICKASDGASVV